MRILVRTSNWAIWARRLGSFALPLALVPVLMHRSAAIDTNAFEVAEVIALAVAILALVVSIGALARIWTTGDHGWGLAVTGLVLSLICLAPVGLFAADYVLYPMADEVTTDVANPPPLVSHVQPVQPPPAVAARLAAAFPNVRSRNYPLDPRQLFAIVDKLVSDRGWELLRRREPGSDGTGQINALATTLFGFRDEVSIRLTGSADGTTVAMRSTALSALHEPGVNGSRIEGFLTALDDRITAMQKDEPAGTADADSDDDSASPPPMPAPAPSPRARKR